jgi:RNA polymerase sigma factor (sigma-70 family)
LKEDAYQEGIIAILEQMDQYKPEISLPETYFRIHIIHNISYFLNKNIYHTSMHCTKKIKTVMSHKKQLEAIGEKPDLRKISEGTGMTEKDVKKTFLHINRVFKYANQTEDKDEIPDENINVENLAISRVEYKKGLKALEQLGEKRKDIISMRFGLNGYHNNTVKAISEHHNMTPYQVNREIEMSLICMKYLMNA